MRALSRLDLAGGSIAVIAINAAYLAAADGSAGQHATHRAGVPGRVPEARPRLQGVAMSERPQVRTGSTRGGTIAGRDLARAVTAGVSQAGEGAPPGNRIRIDTLRVHATEGTDPRQVSAAVRREIERILRGIEP